MKKTLLFILALMGAAGLQAQFTIYVDKDATGNNDGSSWANAYNNLDTALINNINILNNFWVAEGTYTPGEGGGVNRNKIYNLRGNLYGGFDGTETQLSDRDPKTNLTILSGDMLGNDNGVLTATEATRDDNLFSIIFTSSPVIIDGIVFEGGHANVAVGPDHVKSGAAIYSYNNGMDISNCVFRNNFGLESGGVIKFRGPTNTNSWTDIYKNEFYNNGGNSIIGSTRPNTLVNWCYMYIYNNLFHDNDMDKALVDIYNYSIGNTAMGDYSYKMYNNTFVDNSFVSGAPIRIRYEKNSTNNAGALLIETVGNIFANNGANESVLFDDSPVNSANYESHTFYSNLIESNNPIDSASLRASFPQIGGTIVGTSPLFIDKATNDYRILACASPTNDLVNGLNSGLPAAYLDKDFYGNPRTLGIATDIGHCEVQQEASPVSIQQLGTTLEATSGFASYSWFFAQPPFNLYSETTNILTPTDGDGTYAVTVTDTDLCKASTTFDFCSTVSVSIALVGDSLVATGTGGTAFNWYFNGVNVGFNESYTPTQPGTYSVSHYFFDGQQVQGCTASASFIVSCDSLPTAVVANNNGSLEVNADYNTYQWMEGGTNLAGETSASFSPVADGDYQVMVTGAFGCTQTSAVFSFCSSVNVSIVLNNTTLEATAGFATYQWYLVGGSGTGITGANSANYSPTQDGSYYVTASDGNCNGSSNTIVYTTTTTGIKDLAFTDLNVYPNPTSDIINIEVKEVLSSIRIMDLTGKTMQVFHPEAKQLNIGDFTPGIYFLEVANKDSKSIIKLLKK